MSPALLQSAADDRNTQKQHEARPPAKAIASLHRLGLEAKRFGSGGLAVRCSGGRWGSPPIPVRASLYIVHYGSGDTGDRGGNALFLVGGERISNRPHLGLAREKSVDRSGELLASLEELELEDEDEAQQIAAHLLDHLAGRVGRATCSIVSLIMPLSIVIVVHTSGDNVIDHDNLLTRLDGIGLHLEEILAIFLIIGLSLAGSRQLALLAHRNEASTEAQSQAGADQKATSLQTNDDIGLLAAVALKDMQFQRADEGLVQGRVGEDRQDILEQDSRGREVRELAQGSAQSYFKTGEFGGAGGMGGGVSGDLGGGIGEGGRGHDERKRGEKRSEEGKELKRESVEKDSSVKWKKDSKGGKKIWW